MANTNYKYKDYVESEAVKRARSALDAQNAAKPGDYQSKWQDSINDTMDKLLNREKFTYDINGDALYQQYKDQYVTQGRLAMQDTMGQAAALTGGYGNSYAATAGNQAYQGYLQNLNNVIPELYQMAYDMYEREGDALQNQYALLSDRESQDYGRYRDALSDWSAERDFLTGRYDTERSYDRDIYDNNRALDYQQYRDRIADEQWAKNFAEQQRQYNASLAEQQRQYNASLAKATSSGGGSYRTGGTSSSSAKTSADSGSMSGFMDAFNRLLNNGQSKAAASLLEQTYEGGNMTKEQHDMIEALYLKNERYNTQNWAEKMMEAAFGNRYGGLPVKNVEEWAKAAAKNSGTAYGANSYSDYLTNAVKDWLNKNF